MTPRSGVCCNCGNASDDESPCSQRDDGQHCEHWWDGVDDTEGSEVVSIAAKRDAELDQKVMDKAEHLAKGDSR